MTDYLRAKRISRLKLTGGISIALLLLLLITRLGTSAPAINMERLGQPVIPDFATVGASAAEIRIITADESYTLSKASNGWQMDKADGYTVRPDRLAALVTGLQGLTWGEGRTHDPEKFDRIGLGDPRDGGSGAIIQIADTSGKISAEFITGRKDAYIYARYPTDTQAFRVTGELPPLYTHNAWLDFNIIDINPDAVSAFRLYDQTGTSLYLERIIGAGERSFKPAPPFQDYRLVSRLAASTTAMALTRLQPIGVKMATDLTTAPAGRHITQTHDGLEVDLKAYREPDGYYVTIYAVEAGEGARRGITINEKAEGWAFQLNEYDWNDFTPRISSIIRPPAPPPEASP